MSDKLTKSHMKKTWTWLQNLRKDTESLLKAVQNKGRRNNSIKAKYIPSEHYAVIETKPFIT